MSLLSGDDRDALLRFFGSLANSVDARRKFGIEHNGLLLLVAYAMEGIQQTVTSSRELDV